MSRATVGEGERYQLLHESRAYTYYIAEWLRRNRDEYDVVGLQEVFNGVLGFGDRLRRKFRQRDHYRVFSNFRSSIAHGVGHAGFRYENLLLSMLEPHPGAHRNVHLPGKVFFLAACGFTLAPFKFQGQTIWVGNTHFHAYNARSRAKQAEAIALELKRLGDVPVVFMGDFNTEPLDVLKDSESDALQRENEEPTLAILRNAGLRHTPHANNESSFTYPTGLPNRTLDYILFSRHWELDNYEVISEFTFSDHYPVAAQLRLVSKPDPLIDLAPAKQNRQQTERPQGTGARLYRPPVKPSRESPLFPNEHVNGAQGKQ